MEVAVVEGVAAIQTPTPPVGNPALRGMGDTLRASMCDAQENAGAQDACGVVRATTGVAWHLGMGDTLRGGLGDIRDMALASEATAACGVWHMPAPVGIEPGTP